MKRGGTWVTATHDHAPARTDAVVTGGTKNIVAFLPTFKEVPRDRKRKGIHHLAIGSTRRQGRIAHGLAARHRAGHEMARRASILEEVTRFKGVITGLIG